MYRRAPKVTRACGPGKIPIGKDWRMNRGTRRAVLMTIALVLGSFAGASYAQSDAAIAAQFVGMWKLVSRTQRLADGTTRQHPINTAYIIYTNTGHMCYVGMDPNRPTWKSTTEPTPEEALSGITGLGAYCATVEIHAQEGFVIHHVQIERSPNLVGRARKRWFTFEGQNRVTLRIDAPELGARLADDRLIWERVVK